MQPGATQQQGITCIQNIIFHNNKGNYVWDAMYVYLKIFNHAHWFGECLINHLQGIKGQSRGR